MNQKRIIAGCLIGILSFTIVSWISPNSWRGIESFLLSTQSAMRIMNPFQKSGYTVFEFTKDEKINLADKSIAAQKELILNLITELSSKGAESIDLVVSQNNVYQFSDSDLELAIGGTDTMYRSISSQDIEEDMIREEEANLWLDQKQYNIKKRPISDILRVGFDKEVVSKQKIIILSPKIELNKKGLSLIINYLSDRWVNYVPLNPFFSFILLLAAGVFLTALIYWARLISTIAISVSLLILSQIGLSLFNTHLEIVPLLVALVCILIVSSLFDLKLFNFKFQNIFNKKPTTVTQAHISAKPEAIHASPSSKVIENLQYNQVETTQTTAFRQQEQLFEDIALSFQERAVPSVISMQKNIADIISSNRMIASDPAQLNLLQNDFNQLIEEIDTILFDLVPFKFEDERGLICLLEIYATKLYDQTNHKIHLLIHTEFSKLRLSSDERINSYRIIQKLIELILENNARNPEAKFMINLQLAVDNKNLICKINYEGKPVRADSAKLIDLNKRQSTLTNANIHYGITELADFAENIINRLEFSFEANSLEHQRHQQSSV